MSALLKLLDLNAIVTGPCGALSPATHSPTLSVVSTLSPAALPRSPGTIHCTLMHGCGAPASTNAQPAIMNVSDPRRMKSPPAFARVFDETALTLPP